jgi:hypothetical protein
MKMLLIDGVRYEEWTPKSEEEFEQVVSEHTQEIFGEQAIYLDIKQKLKSLSGIGSIPDGYAIILGDSPEWHIVEVELSSHPLHEHIVPQVGRFISGISNPNVQRGIVNAIEGEITGDDFLKLRLRKAIEPTEIYKFLSDLISESPILTIIIEKDTPGLREAISTLRYPQEIKVVEFKTFTREGVSLAVHAHLFEPVYAVLPHPSPAPVSPTAGKTVARKVTFEELISSGLIKDGQVLYFYNTRLFTDERARVIASSNELKYEEDSRRYSKSELAKLLLIKHGFKHDEHGVAGPKYWKTEDGKFLRDLEEQVRSRRGDRF